MATAFKELDDVTECSICTEVFKDPRVLPCVHTYCLKCIKGWGKDKKSGDKLACPLCRKESTIPDDGLEGLPRNFFVDKMLRIKELSKAETQPTPCDMCTYRAESGATQINPATTYCLQCQENYCEICAGGHTQQKVSRGHKLFLIGAMVKTEDLIAQYPPANCDKHEGETLKSYCNDCKLAICMLCYMEVHSGHKCSNINDVVGMFREEMTRDVRSMVDGVKKCKQMLQTLSKEKQNFNEKVNRSEREIREKTKQLKQMIDKHEETILSELKTIKHKRTKEMNTAYEEVERQQAAMESYMKYVNEIREKGTACDIARAASGLHDRAGELMMVDVIERTVHDLGHAVVLFTSSKFVPDDFKKTTGELETNITKIGDIPHALSEVTHVQPGDTGVYGVTSLGDHVYVVRWKKNEVEVYDVVTMALQRRIPVPQISSGGACGIAACPVNKCLYLSDPEWHNPSVIRVDPSTDAVKKWSVAKYPRGLSVTSDHNVVVAWDTESKLQEYTTDGRLVREICLQSGMIEPWHALKLSTGEYVVSHNTSPGVVSVVGVDGQVVRSYGQPPPSDVGLMKDPTSLAVTKHGDVLVVDQHNHRMLAINSSFTRAQVLPLPADVGLRQPVGLFLDESRDRLYIGEFGGNKRLIVVDHVRSIRWK